MKNQVNNISQNLVKPNIVMYFSPNLVKNYSHNFFPQNVAQFFSQNLVKKFTPQKITEKMALKITKFGENLVTKFSFTNFGDILVHFIFTKFGDSLKFSPNLVNIFSIFFFTSDPRASTSSNHAYKLCKEFEAYRPFRWFIRISCTSAL